MTSAGRNLGDILGERRHSSDVAIVSVGVDGSERAWTCAELERGSLGVAAVLDKKGFAAGTRIGILAANSVWYWITYLGIMRSGCVCVPVNTKQPREVIDFICRDADIVLSFVDADGANMLPASMDSLPIEAELDGPDDFRPIPMHETDTALILYTSGSTGRPKGVVLSHASQLAMIDAVTGGSDAALFGGQRGIVVAPMFHMNALVFLASFLQGGGSIVLMAKFAAPEFVAAIARHNVTVITGVPTMVAMLHRAWAQLDSPDLSSVNTVYIGSAPVSSAIVSQSKELMPNAKVLNSYGTTETGGGLFGPHPQGLERPPTSVGHPMPHVELRLEGGEDSGVLFVRAPSAMTEYLNLPDVTAQKCVDGWFNTGDMFTRDADGFYFFVGRADDMFVCSGENVYPGEVEKAIESHEKVVQAAVVPVADEIRGQMPVAFVVRRGAISDREIQEHVKQVAAPYLYPRRVWFVEALPLASTTKVDRRQLIKRAAVSIEEEKNAQT